ncbi:hypothetical protein G6F59_018866 [Rhizopus arrhizus]|nr:hypothetical protein G6F59_018866 [Rhizopus arrhizus]
MHGRRRPRHRGADAGRHHPETPRSGAGLCDRDGQGAGLHHRQHRRRHHRRHLRRLPQRLPARRHREDAGRL